MNCLWPEVIFLYSCKGSIIRIQSIKILVHLMEPGGVLITKFVFVIMLKAILFFMIGMTGAGLFFKKRNG